MNLLACVALIAVGALEGHYGHTAGAFADGAMGTIWFAVFAAKELIGRTA